MKMKSLLATLVVLSMLLLTSPTSLANNSHLFTESSNIITDQSKRLALQESSNPDFGSEDSTCIHHVWYHFDEGALTISGIYDNETVESFTGLFNGEHRATIYNNGKKMTTGPIQPGMIVQIYHNNELNG